MTIYESLVIAVLDDCYYNLRQVLQFTTEHTDVRRPETNRNICHLVLLQKLQFISRATHKH